MTEDVLSVSRVPLPLVGGSHGAELMQGLTEEQVPRCEQGKLLQAWLQLVIHAGLHQSCCGSEVGIARGAGGR